MKLDLKNKKTWVLVGLGVVLLSILVWVTERFLATARGEWAAAIAAWATVALVGVTGWYVWLTRQLVLEQRASAQRTQVQNALAELATVAGKAAFATSAIDRRFPIRIAEDPPGSGPLLKHALELISISSALPSLLPRVPQVVRGELIAATVTMIRVVTTTFPFAAALEIEEARSRSSYEELLMEEEKAPEPFSWHRVRVEYEERMKDQSVDFGRGMISQVASQSERAAMAELMKPEPWEVLVSGDWCRSALEDLFAFQKSIADRLVPP